MGKDKFSRSLNGAVTEILLLRLIDQKPMYGYALTKVIEEITDGKTDKQPGTIYPVLKKMEQNNWIKSEWKFPENNRPQRIYLMQTNGKKHLNKLKEDWSQIKEIIENHIL
jgi:PadR family transcriptional regulator, regulatory protein PadR